jgi:hypothetical protein
MGNGLHVLFEIVFLAAAADEPLVLRATADPNTATLAFHEELQRLTTQGATGELVVLNYHGAAIPLLRQPLAHPERNRRKRHRRK